MTRVAHRCLRRAIGERWRDSYADIAVTISVDDLSQALAELPRSITKGSLQDVRDYCGSASEKRIADSFGIGLD